MGTPAVISFDFTAETDEEISVTAGTRVMILEMFEDGWSTAQKADGQSGLVPTEFVSFVEGGEGEGGGGGGEEAGGGGEEEENSPSPITSANNSSISKPSEDAPSQSSASSSSITGGILNASAPTPLHTTQSSVISSLPPPQSSLPTLTRASVTSSLPNIDLRDNRPRATVKIDFEPQNPEKEVRLRKGDIVAIIAKTTEVWWNGEVLVGEQKGRRGFFRCACVELEGQQQQANANANANANAAGRGGRGRGRGSLFRTNTGGTKSATMKAGGRGALGKPRPGSMSSPMGRSQGRGKNVRATTFSPLKSSLNGDPPESPGGTLGSKPKPPPLLKASTVASSLVASKFIDSASPTPEAPTEEEPSPPTPEPTPESQPDPNSSSPESSRSSSSEAIEPPKPEEPEVEEDSEKKQKHRQFVLDEIVKTEEEYVNDLEIVVTYFLRPIQEKELLPPDMILALFSNVEMLRGVNGQILDQLKSETTQADLGAMGDVFLGMADFLKTYTMYCTNQPVQMATLEKAEKIPAVQAFLDECMSIPECRGLKLNSFLIKPIQRICKYPLLLRDLLRHIPKSLSEHDKIQQAFLKIQEVVDYVNERKRESENMQRIKDLQDSIENLEGNGLITPSRRLLLECPITQLTTGSTVQRTCFMFNDMLLFTKPPSKFSKKKHAFSWQILFQELRIVDVMVASAEHAVELVDRVTEKKKQFCWETLDKKKEFTSQLKAMVKEFQRREALQRKKTKEGSSSQLPDLLRRLDEKSLKQRQEEERKKEKELLKAEKQRQEEERKKEKELLKAERQREKESRNKPNTTPVPEVKEEKKALPGMDRPDFAAILNNELKSRLAGGNLTPTGCRTPPTPGQIPARRTPGASPIAKATLNARSPVPAPHVTSGAPSPKLDKKDSSSPSSSKKKSSASHFVRRPSLFPKKSSTSGT